jgi:hypothetical protein
MAFVLQQTWRSDPRGDAAGGPKDSPLLDPIFRALENRGIGKSLGSLCSIGVQVLLLWLFITKLGSAVPADAPRAEAMQLVSFDLSAAAAAGAERAKPAAAAAAVPAPPQMNEVDLSAESDLPPVEWTVSRISLPAPEPDRPALADAAAGGEGAGDGGRGAGGTGVYDPFAGAAPLRRPNEAAASSVAAGRGLALDRALLERLREAVERELAAGGGTVELIVRVSPTGTVLAATVAGGSAPADVKEAFRAAVAGRPLFRGTAGGAQQWRLPAVTLRASGS